MKNALKVSLLLIGIGVMVSCKKDETGADKSSQRIDRTYNLNADTLLVLVNSVRVKGCNCGEEVKPPVSVLQWNELLATVAYGHSMDMNANQFLAHRGSDGNNLNQRLAAIGYDWAVCDENLASAVLTEKELVANWLNSPTHCDKIMNMNFKELGAGRKGNYWTMVFGSLK